MSGLFLQEVSIVCLMVVRRFGIGSNIMDLLFDAGFNANVEALWTTYLQNVLKPFETQGKLETVGGVEFEQSNE